MNIHIYDWGNIADWLSAVGTVLALVLALVLATKDNRVKLDIQILKNMPRTYEKPNGVYVHDVCITNLRPRTVHIRSVGVYKRKKVKKVKLTKATNLENVIWASLAYGEMMTKELSFGKDAYQNFNNLQPDDFKKLYIGIEDITGKIYFEKFTPF